MTTSSEDEIAQRVKDSMCLTPKPNTIVGILVFAKMRCIKVVGEMHLCDGSLTNFSLNVAMLMHVSLTMLKVAKRITMAFAFWVATVFSCRLLVRLRCCESVYDSQLDLRFDETLVAVGSRSFPEFHQREKPTSDQMNTTFSGQASIDAATSMSSGGYIVMVIMEDLDPVDGSVLGGTIAMVEIEDVATTSNTSFSNGMKNDPALTTVKFSPTDSTITSATLQKPVTKPLRVTSCVGQRRHVKSSIISESIIGIEPRWKLTVRERAQRYQNIVGTVNRRSSENIVATKSQHISVIQEQKSPVHHEAAADSINMSTKTTPQTGTDAAAVGMFMHRLRRRALLRERTQPRTNIPLENALKALRRVDLDTVAAASDTIQKLTKDSRECCARCIEVPASQLIYNVLVRMSCQSSDPIVLHNLLLSLGNLAKYRCWKQQTRQPVTRFERSNARRQLDYRLIDILGEMLLVLSDDLKPHQQQSWSLFTIAAGALWDLVMLVQCARSNTKPDESWIGTRQRLVDLRHRLLIKEPNLPVSTTTIRNRTDQGDLLAGYLVSAAAILAQISSVM